MPLGEATAVESARVDDGTPEKVMVSDKAPLEPPPAKRARVDREAAEAADVSYPAAANDDSHTGLGTTEKAHFPIDCSLTLHEQGYYVLEGICRLCHEAFSAKGCVCHGRILQFNTHAAKQRQMIDHVRKEHGLGWWEAVRQVDEDDPHKRLQFRRKEQSNEVQAKVCEEAEEKSALSVTQKVVGLNPVVVVASDGPLPPRALLPEGTEVSRLQQEAASPLRPEVFPDTVAEARAAGIEAPAAWAGLGVVPKELRFGFRSLLVLGPSGSGKTTLLRSILSELFPDYTGDTYPCGEWAPGLPLIDAFDTAEEGSDFLNSVGLCSVPSWCKPFSILSVGEKYRANVALALRRRRASPALPLVFDEWTSELDRDLARNVSLALGKRMRKEGETAEGSLGPYIFATCHEDVLKYLQPEFICYCSVGEAPLVRRNPLAGAAPTLRAEFREEPSPAQREGRLGADRWAVERTDGPVFTRPHDTLPDAVVISGPFMEEGTLRLSRDGGEEAAEVYPGPWYVNEELRLRMLSRDVLQVFHTSHDGSREHVQELKAIRVKVLQSNPPIKLRTAPAAQKNKRPHIDDYNDIDTGELKRLGWYLPPELQQDTLYTGLQRSCKPLRVSPTCWAPTLDDKRQHYYLAAYVGKADGSLSPKLLDVSTLLDCPFDGLCVQEVPKLPPLREFSVGFITGPSGSGKSSLVRKLFDPCPAVHWSEEPVLAHFDSLSSARELCGAACLDLSMAMRPYDSLSAGEQSRAKIARLLHAAIRCKDDCEARPEQPVVLEEFTSLVDRALARRMARNIQRLVALRGLRIVAVSCHHDFVAAGLLEPEWLFECHTACLLRFHTSASPASLSELEKVLEDAKAAESCTARLLHKAERQLAESCFSDEFRAEASKFLESHGARELERRRSEIADLTRALSAGISDNAASAAAEMPEEVCCIQEEMYKEPPEKASAEVVTLEVRRALHCEWAHFMEHHYKDHKLHPVSIAFVGLVAGRLACFTAIIREPMHNVQRAVSNKQMEGVYPSTWLDAFPPRMLFREHRTVVLPDFQGLGLGPLLCDAVAAYVGRLGHDFTSQTIHPFYGGYRDRSPYWRPLPSNHLCQQKFQGNMKYSHFFMGATQADGSEDPRLRQQLAERVALEMAL